MKILVACEFSGAVRDAFLSRGHDAVSCDLLPTDKPGPHIQDDILKHINDGWDLMIAHPPCTYLTVSGNKWFKDEFKDRFPDRQKQREEAISFFMALANAPIPKIAIENPIGIMSRVYRKPDQIIQPYFFNEPFQKTTCLWLKGLPPLIPTVSNDFGYDWRFSVDKGEIYTFKSGRRQAKWYADMVTLPKEERMKQRSKTFRGIAEAMATQWG